VSFEGWTNSNLSTNFILFKFAKYWSVGFIWEKERTLEFLLWDNLVIVLIGGIGYVVN
jgi:tRNA G37 N-methylase Trm5